jgi:hypothetical protein
MQFRQQRRRALAATRSGGMRLLDLGNDVRGRFGVVRAFLVEPYVGDVSRKTFFTGGSGGGGGDVAEVADAVGGDESEVVSPSFGAASLLSPTLFSFFSFCWYSSFPSSLSFFLFFLIFFGVPFLCSAPLFFFFLLPPPFVYVCMSFLEEEGETRVYGGKC